MPPSTFAHRLDLPPRNKGVRLATATIPRRRPTLATVPTRKQETKMFTLTTIRTPRTVPTEIPEEPFCRAPTGLLVTHFRKRALAR